MNSRTPIVLAVLLLTVGCARTRTYDVVVRNQTREPITIGLVKEGGPFERKWESPEEAAKKTAAPDEYLWRSIGPGEEARSGPVSGRFYRNSHAVLRVYEGNLNLSEILAVSSHDPNRVDIPLHTGTNSLVVSDLGGEFTASRVEFQQPTHDNK